MHHDLIAVPVPAFNRLSDYFGPWLLESSAWASHWQFARSPGLAAHLGAPAPRLASTLSTEKAPGGRTVATIRLSGLLMKSQSSMGGTSTVQARRDLRSAASNPDVAGIMLHIDSPGGTVAGTDDLANEVKAARRQKPVWAFVEDLGASAAYWVASQAEVIFANSPSALVGSIGTMQVIYDQSGAAEKEGVKAFVFKTGPLKGAGVPGSQVTDEQQAYFQDMVNQIQQTFDAAVVSGRRLSAAGLAQVKSGGVYIASQAKTLGLIDGVQSLDKTIADMAAGKKPGAAGASHSLPAIREHEAALARGAAPGPAAPTPAGPAPGAALYKRCPGCVDGFDDTRDRLGNRAVCFMCGGAAAVLTDAGERSADAVLAIEELRRQASGGG